MLVACADVGGRTPGHKVVEDAKHPPSVLGNQGLDENPPLGLLLLLLLLPLLLLLLLHCPSTKQLLRDAKLLKLLRSRT